MKYAAAFDAFIVPRHALPWVAGVMMVTDDVIDRNELVGGTWIVSGNQGTRLGGYSRRRAPRHHNDAELVIP